MTDPAPTQIAADPLPASGLALITGGGSGIGRALGQALRARGWRVAIADLDSPAARAGAAEMGADSLRVDLRDPAASAGLLARCDGLPDLICSNAGVARNKRLRKEPLGQEALDLMEVNAFAVVRLAQAYLTQLEAAGQRGRLLVTASENSLSQPQAVKTFGLGLYAASKHAVLALCEWLAGETDPARLRLQVLLPGPVYWPPLVAAIPDPGAAPPGFELISCEACAAIALQGMEMGLFYIPTHRHLPADMAVRAAAVAQAAAALRV